MALGTPAIDTLAARTFPTTMKQTVDAAAQVTEPFVCTRRVALQVTGAATAINGVLERSTVAPTNSAGAGGNWTPVDAALSGNPSTGINVLGYNEPGVAWWRFRVVSITGVALISLSTGAN